MIYYRKGCRHKFGESHAPDYVHTWKFYIISYIWVFCVFCFLNVSCKTWHLFLVSQRGDFGLVFHLRLLLLLIAHFTFPSSDFHIASAPWIKCPKSGIGAHGKLLGRLQWWEAWVCSLWQSPSLLWAEREITPIYLVLLECAFKIKNMLMKVLKVKVHHSQ